MSKLSNQLGALSDYYCINRGVGHTSAMIEGVFSVPSIVMTHNQENANNMKSQKGLNAISIQGDLNKLRGSRLPMVFDNAALFVLFSQASVALNKLEMENITLSRDIAISCEANYQLRKEIANLKEKNFVLDYKIEKAKADLE